MEDVLRPTQTPRIKQTQNALKMLLEAAMFGNTSSPSELSPASSKENHSGQLNGEPIPMADKEAKQLRAIKNLMDAKGFESMMKFLES
jgi:hypothetical protein